VITDRVWDGEFIQPLDNEVSTVFGVKRIMNKKKTSLHRGVDFRGKSGEPVRAFNRGRVVLADELFYGGNTVILDHGQGIYSIYMHLSKFNVKVNDILEKGTVVGRVGSSGRATGPHLHFGVKIRSINTNPLSFLELGL
jgi:murein DD-endopeptidase MepM/ murein hydrolase activator NlpD